MVDMNTDLGRPVPTTRQLLEVLRPQIRVALCCAPATVVGLVCEDGSVVATDEGDVAAVDAVIIALQADGVSSVKTWARDMGLAYDGAALQGWIEGLILEIFTGIIDPAVAEVLALDPDANIAIRTLHGALVSVYSGCSDSLLLP